MANNTDPNLTSGRLNSPTSSFSYPLNENLANKTRLRFVEYNRYTPSDPGQEKTTAIVSLPLPIHIPDNYNIRTNNQTDFGVFGNFSQGTVDQIKDKVSGGFNVSDIVAWGQSLDTELIKSRQFPGDKLIAGLAALGGDSAMGRAAQAFVGITQNPHTTIMFEGVNLRSINLEWRLSARSEQESQAIRDIFNTLKLRSHPEELGMGYALNYPDLVYVEFSGNVENYLPKFQKAFINNINITPDSPGGAIALYKSGAPVTYTLQLSMTELSILTRNTISDQIGNPTPTARPSSPLVDNEIIST